MKKIFLILFLFSVCSFSFADVPKKLLSKSKQLIIVTTPTMDSVMGEAQRFTRSSINNMWKAEGKPIPVVVGKKGVAWDRQFNHLNDASLVKQEGDSKTPLGIYEIGPSFGFDEVSPFKADYFPLNDTSVCVDDVKSDFYNKLVDSKSVAGKDWDSGEQMRQVPQYQYGAIVQYNTHPLTHGAGSCIFLHIWKGPTTGTAGCIAMEASNLKNLLSWLDPSQKPLMVVLPKSDYSQLKAKWKLPRMPATL